MSLNYYLQKGLEFLRARTYPVFEVGSVVVYSEKFRERYARVISARLFKSLTSPLYWREERNHWQGRLVCVRTSYGGHHLIEADLLRKLEVSDISQVIEDLQHLRDKTNGRERVELVSIIEFLEDSLRTQPRH